MDDYLMYDCEDCMDGDTNDYCEGCFADCPMQNPEKNFKAYIDCISNQ